MDLESGIDAAWSPVQALINEGRLPGAALGVIDAAGGRAVRVGGSAQLVPEIAPIARDTVFDLASVTKALFTTTAILKLVRDGALGLDQQLAELIPDFQQHQLTSPLRAITVRDCLTHQTSLPAHAALYTLGLDPPTLEAYVLQYPWPEGPAVYSDLNFILLGIVVERTTGAPLGEQSLPPGFTSRPDPHRAAATEQCAWRRRVLRGEVHDENAAAFGGLAGHAGLFAPLDAVLDEAARLLDEAPDPQSYLHALLHRQTRERALGWEASHAGWAGGSLTSEQCIGHTGFTGTGVWVDFELGIAWSLLSNRVHPSRHGSSPAVTLQLRPLVADLLIGTLTGAKQQPV